MDMDKYYLALGKFITAFADTEGLVFAILTREARVYPPAAQALFSGVRARGAMDLIARLSEAKGRPLNDLTKSAFRHLSAINTARDQLAHWGIQRFGEYLETSNSMRAHTDAALKTYRVSPETVNTMTFDLTTIKSILSLMTLSVQEDDPQYQALASFVAVPWRYTPPQPVPRRSKSDVVLDIAQILSPERWD